MTAEYALDLLRHHGPLALVLVMALNRIGLVPGGMVILLMVGALTGHGALPVLGVLLAAYVGTMIGDSALYAAGRYGLGWLRRGAHRPEAPGRAQRYIERWGGPAVFVTRWLMLPLTIAASLICGLNRFRYQTFVLAGAAGNLLFVLIFVGAGYRFGGRWDELRAWASQVVAGVLAGELITFLLLALIPAALLAFRAAGARHLVAPDASRQEL